MTLDNLLRIGKLKAHAADDKEIARLLESAGRTLKDASVAALSSDSRLELAYRALMQAALWFHGGNLMQSRHYSLYLALQLKARMEGISTPVFGLDPFHHLR